MNVNFLKIYLFTTSKIFDSGLDFLRQGLALLLRLASGLWQTPELVSSVLGWQVSSPHLVIRKSSVYLLLLSLTCGNNIFYNIMSLSFAQKSRLSISDTLIKLIFELLFRKKDTYNIRSNERPQEKRIVI